MSMFTEKWKVKNILLREQNGIVFQINNIHHYLFIDDSLVILSHISLTLSFHLASFRKRCPYQIILMHNIK